VTGPVDAIGFHIGIVVRDADAAAATYHRLFGGTYGAWDLTKAAPGPTNPTLGESLLHVVYGRFAGMTIEFIEVVEGRGIHAKWLEDHGEGIHHLGFWVPDLADATRTALEQGATLTSAVIDPTMATVCPLTPDDVALALRPGAVHLNLGVAAFELEFLSSSTVDTLAAVFGDRLTEIVDLPPWAGTGGDPA
jgi:methylmalonyl-CoA/ethylmalonyl-CoA epimerase